jgi:putative hydrolase of the HAD superfamily
MRDCLGASCSKRNYPRVLEDFVSHVAARKPVRVKPPAVDPGSQPPAVDGWSLCNHRPVSTSSPVRLVLFDVDGTLVDHDGAAAAGAQKWLMAMGWADSGTIAGLVSEWDEIAERHFPAYRARLTTFQGQRRLRLREFLPRVGIDASTWSDERLDELFNSYLVAYEDAWRSFADAEPCLGALRSVAQIAVLSNGNQEQQEEKISRTGLGRYIDIVLTSDQLGVAKPDPRAFELACVRLGVPARAAVYVGDQLEVDALAATAAGLRGIWLNRNGGSVPRGVEAVGNLTDLPSLLEELRVI